MENADFLEVDAPIGGQTYTCLSFISPETVIREKNVQYLHKFLKTVAKNYDLDRDTIVEKYKDFLYINEDKLEEEYNQENDFATSVRGVKVRGVYSSLKEAQFRAKKLQSLDPNFNVYVGQVGYWLPWDPRPDKIAGQEYAEGELNELVKKYQENQDNKDLHFRENIEYVKDQEAKKKTKSQSVVEDTVEKTTSDDSSALNDMDPWLKRKTEEASESQVNASS
uniref:Uncharacterized protein n=1 Tax=viral metagenome TaxID=1070528 RepID=A0A6C0B3G4_9ZZZZ